MLQHLNIGKAQVSMTRGWVRVLKIMDNIMLFKVITASHSLFCPCFPGALLYENAKGERKDGQEKDRRAESGVALKITVYLFITVSFCICMVEWMHIWRLCTSRWYQTSGGKRGEFLCLVQTKFKSVNILCVCACGGYVFIWCSVGRGWGCVWQHATERTTPSWPPSCLGSNPALMSLNWKLSCLAPTSLMTTGKTKWHSSVCLVLNTA